MIYRLAPPMRVAAERVAEKAGGKAYMRPLHKKSAARDGRNIVDGKRSTYYKYLSKV